MKKWRVVIYKVKDYEDIVKAIKREKFPIQVYRPVVQSSISKKGVIHIIERPLLFNYMFWKTKLEVLDLDYMNRCFRFRILKMNGKYTSISGKEISRIKRVVKSQNGKFEKTRTSITYLRKMIGQTIIVRDGVFSGMVGVIKEVRKAGAVMVELMIFSRPILCEISVEYIERASS